MLEKQCSSLKIVVVGNANTNKSTFIKRLLDINSDKNHELGIDFIAKSITVENQNYKIKIWDTSGQELLHSLIQGYIKNSNGAFILYNISIKSTFDSVPNYIKEIRNIAGPNVVIMLVGNKCQPSDTRVISTEEGKSLADREHLIFTETSTWENKSLADLLISFVKEINKVQREQEVAVQPKKSFFSFFGNNKSSNDKKSSIENNNNDDIKISRLNYDEIISRVRFLENNLSKYEPVKVFNFETYKCDKIIENEHEKNFLIDEEIESFHVILEELEEGEKYKAFKIIDKRDYCVKLKKVLKTEETIRFNDLQKTIREFDVLQKINHPCICKTYGINLQEKVDINGNEDLTTVAIFLEYLDFNLKTCIEKNILSNSMKVKIIVEIAFGMSHLHKLGIIHRNLNIENIMMNRYFEAKIINFGQVHLHESISNESNYEMTKNIGDFAFMSPEMQNDEDKYDNKTDVYSFGVIIFNLLTGKLPNISIKDIINKVPPTFPSPSHSISVCCIELIKMCMIYEPSERPSFDEILIFMKDHLFAFAEDVDIETISQRYELLKQLSTL